MRQILFQLSTILCASLVFVSCDDKNTAPDDNCTVWINGQDKAGNKALCEYQSRTLTAAEVCRLGNLDLTATNGSAVGCSINPNFDTEATIDTINNRIGLRTFHNSGSLNGVLFSREYKFTLLYVDTTHFEFDTVAYIPNKERLAVIDTLTYLYDESNGGWDENWETIQKIANEAFTFIPCTGAELRELEAAGLN